MTTITSRITYVVGWATAIVCHFLANYYWILGHEVNRLVIETLGLQDSAEHYSFDSSAPDKKRRLLEGKHRWPDLPPYAWDPGKTPDDVARDLRHAWTDPSKESSISGNVAKKIIGPILDASGTRPARARCTGMLNGPPGTRKTSLVRTTARVMRWPLVTVPGSVILANGWDNMEARATDVFRKLSLLTNCVIFFDEYEEFFRARDSGHPAAAFDNRTVAAFMTSGMLPRLQDLHDGGRCLIFLATNYPKSIDEAVRRSGRFDFQLNIPHPKAERALEYVDEKGRGVIRRESGALSDDQVERVLAEVKGVIQRVGATNGDDGIPFKNVEAALRSAARSASVDQMAVLAHQELGRGENMDAPELANLD